ncbi:hypothetical protein KKE06_03785 [Candidatus Micrarchaeota archaeon]|nr:hypothetical protein [Candidatus Micrarchaeota archaeon]MBU1930369.1 hypothetical protein [Candidatus Micrarchaeota archaeon]
MNWMHKFLLIVALLVLVNSVQAVVFLVSPVSTALEANASFSLGEAMPGETIELVFSNEDGKGGYWNQVTIVEGSLPGNWIVSQPELFAESLVLSISIPKEETEKLQNMRFRLSNTQNPLTVQEISLKVVLKNDLIKTSFSSVQEFVSLGETASYQLVVLNNSIAAHTIVIRSSLPSFWFEPQTIVVPAKQNFTVPIEAVLKVSPKSYGLKSFSFLVDSGLNEKRLDAFQIELLVKPTLKGKFGAGLFGFSFFSPNLSVFYFFNALLGSIQ